MLRTNSTALFPLYDSSSTCWGSRSRTARNRVDMFSDSDRRFWDGVWDLWSDRSYGASWNIKQPVYRLMKADSRTPKSMAPCEVNFHLTYR